MAITQRVEEQQELGGELFHLQEVLEVARETVLDCLQLLGEIDVKLAVFEATDFGNESQNGIF